ncbi:LytTR family transcriptional regulator DNA-binding domain-containing protein [Calidifontibacillus erzurumensis]|uniref:LytTR family transcriptional regulator DNA-binding domain-containing protein n=1 Tax=Calidifontibacillus erzurumensis TaxID=2741433 RepID=UPI0035B542FF
MKASYQVNFVRAHRFFIINKSFLKELNKQDNNNFIAEFYNAETKTLVSKCQLENLFS